MKSTTTEKKVNMSKRGLIILGIVVFAGIFFIGRLAYLQIINGEYYSAKVESQKYANTEIKAERGKIYDANMKVLAQSASVWKVYLNPSKINDFKEDERDNVRKIIAKELAEILDMSEETLLGYTQKNYSYQSVKGGIEKNERDKILEMINKYKNQKPSINLNGIICIDPDVKRYYAYDSLASTVIGFTGTDGVGRAGLEYYYNDILTGVSGKTITAQDGMGNEMPNQYKTVYDAQEGTGIVLTIDMYVQYVLESVLEGAYKETGAENVYGIVMDVDTGAILGMASLPDYDLNDPYTIKSEDLYNEYLKASEKEIKREDYKTESEYNDAVYLASLQYFRDIQWSNRNVSSTYEPGSVYKIVTAAAALEEGKATLDTEFYCNGSINYASRNINCWVGYPGHREETFADLLKNSCNPFAITLADRLGRDTFYDYFEAFGFTEKTGVDTTGDFTPIPGVLYKSRENFTQSDLASYSFGQTFQVSPLQVITAVSAVANGGKLMTPYIVSKQVDEDQNVISETVPTVRRQVISETTANKIASVMRDVVATGTGKNANAEGYRVAGKTGTSEKLTNKEEEVYIASFCGFAPADDPEIAVIIIVDEPEGAHGGGAVAAPLARAVFEQVLPYLGVEKLYTEEEAAKLFAKVPNLLGKSISDAKAEVSDSSLQIKVVGDGDTVVAQYPDAEREISKDGLVVVYTDVDTVTSTVTVPDFTNCTVSQANRLAVNSGLNITISGSSLDENSAYAYAQSIKAGTETRMGEIITVSFKTNVNVGD